MLRITISKRNDHPMYVLEGRLAGEWVQELVWATRDLGPGTKAVVDIEHLHYADALAEKALHWLSRLGAVFVVQNPYGVDLCERLKLRRLTMAESDPQKQERKGRSGKSIPSAPSHSPRRRPSRGKS